MKENKASAASPSSEKEGRNAKTFRIPISNGIFEHYGRLKDARWLLDLFVDWTTKEVRTPDGSFDGVVLGGKPIRDEDTAIPFGCCARTTRRWRQRLARFGYIAQLRTPMGYVIRVKKSKKWPERPDKSVRSDRTKMSDHSESEVQGVSDQNYQVCPIRTTDRVRSNKDSAVQDKDRAAEEATTAAAFLLKAKPGPEWEAIGIHFPVGGLSFKASWRAWYVENEPRADSLVWLMEEFIQKCQAEDIPVPPPFFAAKRKLEREDEEEGDRSAEPGRPAVQI
jgi:hypothetical protein